MKIFEADDQRQALIDHVDRRWRQLHELEIKRGDAAINFLFLVSGGAAAATLAFIGNAMKDGHPLPAGAIWMLGCFAVSLLLVGLMKGWLIHQAVAIYKNWREQVDKFYRSETEWKDLIESDEAVVKKRSSLVYWLGWSSYAFLVAGVVIGFVKLEEGAKHVRQEKPAITAPAATTTETSRSTEKSVGHQTKSESDRNVTSSTAPTTTPEKEVAGKAKD